MWVRDERTKPVVKGTILCHLEVWTRTLPMVEGTAPGFHVNLHCASCSAWGEIQCPDLGSQCGPRCWRLPLELPWKGDIAELTGNRSVADSVLVGTKGKRNESQRMSFSYRFCFLLPKSAALGYHVGGAFSLGFLFFFSFLMN